MSEQQWYCPNCGPEISVTVERIHTFSGPDDYIVCTGCGETVDEKAETPAFVITLQQRIAALEAACEASRRYVTIVKSLKNSAITEIARRAAIDNLCAWALFSAAIVVMFG